MLPQIFIFERNLNRFSQDFSGILREKSIREELRATPHAIRDDNSKRVFVFVIILIVATTPPLKPRVGLFRRYLDTRSGRHAGGRVRFVRIHRSIYHDDDDEKKKW